jgi:putative flippase GtrA
VTAPGLNADDGRGDSAEPPRPSFCPAFFRLPEPVRFLLAGGWNTVFGFAVYAALYALLGTKVHYLLLLIPANVLAITNCFLAYKYLVFRTRGNGWAEYLKCWLVYGAIALLNAGMMWLLVNWAGMGPVPANGLSIIIATVASYLSHKHFSFAAPRRRQ